MDLVHGSFGLEAQLEEVVLGVRDADDVVEVEPLFRFVLVCEGSVGWRMACYMSAGDGDKGGGGYPARR